jgi:hypothetical protein
MNAALSEQPLPQDWNARRGLLLFFEWPGGQRNASAMPQELAAAKSFRPDASIAVLDATGNARAIQEGTNWDDLVVGVEHSNTCHNHLNKLAQAARKFARDNDGRLPGRDTWEADVSLYLMGDAEGEDAFRCPAAPDLDRGYAINEQVAGKDAKELPGHDSLILFFESDLNVPNAAGLPQRDAPVAGRHVDEWNGGRTNNVVYLSGTIGSQPALVAKP